jgi:hypothetical protein
VFHNLLNIFLLCLNQEDLLPKLHHRILLLKLLELQVEVNHQLLMLQFEFLQPAKAFLAVPKLPGEVVQAVPSYSSEVATLPVGAGGVHTSYSLKLRFVFLLLLMRILLYSTGKLPPVAQAPAVVSFFYLPNIRSRVIPHLSFNRVAGIS